MLDATLFDTNRKGTFGWLAGCGQWTWTYYMRTQARMYSLFGSQYNDDNANEMYIVLVRDSEATTVTAVATAATKIQAHQISTC